jgi:hypothetical protein
LPHFSIDLGNDLATLERMMQKSILPIGVLLAIFSAADVRWCFAKHQSSSVSSQAPGNSTSTSAASDSASAHQTEGCKLGAYTGATPLNQLPYYSPGEEDLRGGMTCIFSINSKLPLFTFYVAGQADNTLGNIEIRQGGIGEVIQTIESTTDPGLIAPATSKDVLTAVDANFDGYNDLQLLIQCGATGNCSYDFYLYDPKKNEFVHNDFLSTLTTPSFDQAKKQVTMSSNSSASDWEKETYQYAGGQYTLIHREESIWDRDKGAVTVNTYELRNGQMRLVDSTTKPE